jgi:hypothetical protein
MLPEERTIEKGAEQLEERSRAAEDEATTRSKPAQKKKEGV